MGHPHWQIFWLENKVGCPTMGVEILPEVCSPLDPGLGRGGILRLSLFWTFATQIFLKIFSGIDAGVGAWFARIALVPEAASRHMAQLPQMR